MASTDLLFDNLDRALVVEPTWPSGLDGARIWTRLRRPGPQPHQSHRPRRQRSL